MSPTIVHPLSSIALAAALVVGFACDTDDPPPSLVEQVAAAVGVSTLPPGAIERIEATGERFEPGEGYNLEQALDLSDFAVDRSASVDAAQLRQSLVIDAYSVLPQRLQFTETIDRDAGLVEGTDNIFGNAADRTPLMSGRIAGQLRHGELTSPLRLARLAQTLDAAGRVAELDAVEIEGRLHRVLELHTDDAAPTRLLIDPDTLRIAKAETLEDHPPNVDTEVEVSFGDYRQIDGAWIPFEVSIVVDGRLVHTERCDAAQVVVAEPDGFAIPTEFQLPFDAEEAARARRASQWYAGFFHGGFSFFYFDQWKGEVEDVELAPGVHLLRGPSHHNLLVEQADSLVIVDAPMYDGRTSKVLEHVAAQAYGSKPLRHVVATHFHQDHCGGIRAFAAEGNVTVVAGSPSVSYFEEVFERAHTLVPDRYAGAPQPVVVQGVDDAHRIEDPERPVELYRIANSHAEDMLIVYLPTQKILFTADLYGPNPQTSGSLLIGDYVLWAGELYDEVQRRGLDVQTVVGAHGEGTATWEDVRIGGGR